MPHSYNMATEIGNVPTCCKEVIALQIFSVEGEVVDIENEPTKEEAVQLAWEITIMEGMWIDGRLRGLGAC